MPLDSDLRISGTKVQYYNKFHNIIIIMLLANYAECVANDEKIYDKTGESGIPRVAKFQIRL